MKIFIKFIGQSFLVGIVIIGVLYSLIHYSLVLIKDYKDVIEPSKILLVFLAAVLIGGIFSLINLNPIASIAQLFLKGVALFYQEFFKQGAKYFTVGNTSRPFQTIVEVAFDNNIRILGFLTNKIQNDCCVVFIPTSRRLTSGFNIIVKTEKVTNTDISPDEFLKYIVTSGAHPVHFNL